MTSRPRLADALGSEAALSKSTVSRVCEAIKVEFEAWRGRDLSEVELDYLYLDGSHFKFHAGARGRTGAGRLGDHHRRPARASSALAPGASESHDAWADFLADLVARGLARRCSSSPTARRD